MTSSPDDGADRRLGIEHLTEIGISPLKMVGLAAAAGCANISILAEQWQYNPLGYPYWSLLKDRCLRTGLKQALADHGVSISLGEGFAIAPNAEISSLQPAIDLFAELGARRINGVPMEADGSRSLDQFAILNEMAAAAGLEVTIEFVPIMAVRTLSEGLALRSAIGSPNVTLLLDLLHFIRAGLGPADLYTIDTDAIGYVQICDGLLGHAQDYADEAINDRMVIGAGEFPVLDLITALPRTLILSAEVPQVRLAKSGFPVEARIEAIMSASLGLLSRLGSAGSNIDSQRI